MVLKFHGGVRINAKKLFADSNIKNIGSCSAVCINAGEDFTISEKEGSDVLRGRLLGFSNGTPVYASVSGRFNGVLEIMGDKYFVVMSNGENGAESPFQPETRNLTDLSREDIIEAARKFAIIDSRSGRPLWELLSEISFCKRVVVDCTEPFPHSALIQQLCIEKAKELVYGGKVLVHATGALKCVFAFEHSKKKVLNALQNYAGDGKLFAAAPMEEKYPYTDGTLMYALYVKNLDENETPAQNNILIVGAEAVIALFESMLTGMPQTYRYITLCGNGMENGGNFRVPRGITFHDLEAICQGFPKDKLLIENSLLSGKPVGGALADTTIAIISDEHQEKTRSACISCGACGRVCPSMLFPAEVLLGTTERLQRKCISCGACEYICPSGIPLLKLIKNPEGENE